MVNYEVALRFPQDPIDEKDSRFRALQRAHAIRMFEIDLYWKRSTYFWVLQASVFAGLGLVAKELSSQSVSLLLLMLSCVGFLCALAGFLSARGSKFWQQNWERHIDRLEDLCEGSLHKSLWLPGGKVSWSVTRVNDVLTFGFTLFWAAATAFIYRSMFPNAWLVDICVKPYDGARTASMFCLLITIALAFVMSNQKSRKFYTVKSDLYDQLDPDAVLEVRKLPLSTPPA